MDLHLVRRRGPYQNGEARRLQIINATTSVFATDGYVGGSLRRIAAQVGVTEPALLRHFGSKRALLLTTLATRIRIVSGKRPSASCGLKSPDVRSWMNLGSSIPSSLLKRLPTPGTPPASS